MIETLSTEELLIELAKRMRYTQNSTAGRELGRMCETAVSNLDPGVLRHRSEPVLGFTGTVCAGDMTPIGDDHPVEWLRGKRTIEFACDQLPQPTIIGPTRYRVTMTPEPEPEQLTLGGEDD